MAEMFISWVDERANEIPNGKTVWDVIEEKLIEYKDIPAIEYFGSRISRPEFINMVYVWAKAFKAMGVREELRLLPITDCSSLMSVQ